MDNDNKIDNSINDLHKQVMLFLGDEVDKIHKTGKTENYDIEKEYAKTKRNHSPANFFVLFGAFLIVIGTVFFINKYISVKDEEITVSVDEFEDLNLNNLLDTVNTAQMNYDQALEKKHTLEAEMESKLNKLKSDLDNELFVLESMNLGAKEYRSKKSKAESKYNNDVDEINKQYESQLLLATKQVDAYKTQLDEFDSVKVANAQERERLLNSEKQLHKIEIDKITAAYEERIKNLDEAIKNIRIQSSKEMREAVNNVVTKYQAEIDALDPKITDIKANLILSSVMATDDFNGPFELVSADIKEPELVKSVKKYQGLYDDYKYLDDAVRAIPQQNSISSYVAATRSLVNNMSETYIDSSISFYNKIVEKNNEITGLNTKINEMATEYETNIAADKTAHEQAMSSAIEAHTLEVNQLNEAHTNEITLLKSEYENQLKTTTESYETKIKEANDSYKKDLEAAYNSGNEVVANMFNLLGFDAILVNAAGYENILVSVNPEKYDLIPAEGIAATITGESPITGKLLPAGGGNYFFEVGKDLEGNLFPVDFALLVPGAIVEIDF